MANEKSRNHDTKGGNGGASKHQGKPKDQDDAGSKTADATGDGGKGGEAKGTGPSGR
jgi:hypothetical protein